MVRILNMNYVVARIRWDLLQNNIKYLEKDLSSMFTCLLFSVISFMILFMFGVICI